MSELTTVPADAFERPERIEAMLTAKLDFDLACSRSRSLERLLRKFDQLLDML